MSIQRHSKKREAILDCVRNTDSHPTAEWVYTQLKPQFPDLSLGTVYRNLAAFKEDGTIASLGVIGGMERFDRELAPHAHFRCQKCGRIIDVEHFHLPEELTAAVDCGRVLESAVMFTGICKECADKSAN